MNAAQTAKQRAALRGGALLVLITLCAASLFFAWQRSDFTLWQYDSEGLVVGRVYQLQTGQSAANPAGFLGGFETAASENKGEASAYDQRGLYFDDTPVTAQAYWAYTHQPGVQGTLWGIANRVLCLLRLPAQTRLAVLHFGSVWLLCAAVCAVCVWAKREWGLLPAVLCGAGLLLSPWTLRACANLYWQLWLYVALFALSAFAARACERKGALPVWGALCLFAGLLLRFLCGFEFTSTVLVCAEVPFVYYGVKHWADGKAARVQWLRAAVCVGGAGLAAFAGAMLLWFWQLCVHLGGANAALAEMLVPIANRTGALGAAQAAYGASLSHPLGEVLRLYFQSDTVLPGLTALTLLGVWLLVLGTALFFCARKRQAQALRTHAALGAAVVTGVLGVLSWLVLARGHAAVHPHINYMLWLLPVVPLCCAQLGLCISTLLPGRGLGKNRSETESKNETKPRREEAGT